MRSCNSQDVRVPKYVFSLSIFALSAAMSQQTSAQTAPGGSGEWEYSESDNKNQATLTHKSQKASINLVYIDDVQAANSDETAQKMISNLSQTGICGGLVSAKSTPLAGGTAQEWRGDNSEQLCSIMIQKSADGNVMMLVVEQAGINANARQTSINLITKMTGKPASVSSEQSPSTTPAAKPYDSVPQTGAATPVKLAAVVAEAKKNAPATQGAFFRAEFTGGSLYTYLYMFLSDGRYFDMVDTAIEDFAQYDPSGERQGRWTRKGKMLHLIDKDGDEEGPYEAEYLVTPFPAGTRLSGSYRSVTGSMVGFGSTGGAVLTSYIYFDTNGRFATTSDAAISISTNVGTGSGVDIAGGGDNPTQTGLYHIEGTTLHLLFDDGSIRRSTIVEVKGGGVGDESVYYISGKMYFTD